MANRSLCEGLMHQGDNVAVITCRGGDNQMVDCRKGSFHILPSLGSWGPVQIGMPLFARISSIFRHFRPEIVHLQVPSLLSYATLIQARKMNIPVVAGIHDLPENVSVYSPLMKSVANHIARFILAKWFSQVNTLAAPSEYAKSFYQTLGVKSDIQVISNGVDRRTFCSQQQSENSFTRKYVRDWDRSAFHVLYVGRISPEKNLEVLMEAVREIDATAILVGPHSSNRYLNKLKSLADSSGNRIILTGPVSQDELIGAYGACDALVQPSTCELQSLVVLEAMSCAKPVIACRHGPFPELITEGKNGFLFSPFYAKDLGEKIQWISAMGKSRRLELSLDASKTVAKHSLDQTVGQYLELYQQLVSRN